MRKNLTILTDAYKIGHHLQRPQNITKLYSYGEPRVGGVNKEICFFGSQVLIQENFLQKITDEMIKEGKEECISTFGTDKYFNEEAWKRVKDLEYLPLRIKSAPEGMIIEEGNVCFTMESTEPWFANMISHFEDILMWVRKLCPVIQ
jgi:nicotinamide phosphoribosyltransferase